MRGSSNALHAGRVARHNDYHRDRHVRVAYGQHKLFTNGELTHIIENEIQPGLSGRSVRPGLAAVHWRILPLRCNLFGLTGVRGYPRTGISASRDSLVFWETKG